MKKPNLQRLAQRSKIYLRKASPTILSGLGAAGVIVTSVLAVRATPKALRKIRADSKTNHDGDPEAYSKLEAVKSAWVCYIPAAISGTATIFCIFGANVLSKRQQAALTSAYVLLNDSYNNYKDKLKELYGEEAHQKIVDAIAAEKAKDVYITSTGLVRNSSLDFEPLEGGDTVGWSIDTGIYWIDFNHSKVTLDDGLEVLVIDMDWVPDAGWDSE